VQLHTFPKYIIKIVLLTTLAAPTLLRAQESTKGPKRENGDIAVSAVTVIDGAYGSSQIATLSSQSGAQYNFVTSVPLGALNPDFTPDGARIFFGGSVPNGPDGVFSVFLDGGTPIQLRTDCITNPNCFGEGNPAVSPDGRELLIARAFGPVDNNGCLAFGGIYRLHIDGSHAKRVSDKFPPCTSDFEPHWSPDGHRIVFQHQDTSGLFSIWVMGRDGSHRHQITPIGMDVGDPDWSPDGRRIVFQSPADPADDQHPQQVYTIHPDGSHLVQITHYAIVPGLPIGTFGSRWSPDGQKLVFAHRDSSTTVGPDNVPHADLFVMNPDGSDVVQITFSPEKDNAPAWGVRR